MEPGRDYRANERRTLLEHVNKLWAFINQTEWDPAFFTEKKELLYRNLQLIRADSTIHFELSKSITRQKRGLIDGGGWLLNKVFGLATEEQVKAIQRELTKSARQEQAIVHNVNKLITIMNQTRLEEKATRKYLRQLEIAHNELVLSEKAKWLTVGAEQQLLMMENMVQSLNNIDEGLHRELNNIDKLHNTLRLGILTEDICPIELIAEIVKQADIHGLVPLEMAWYYQNVKVEPLMIQDGKMVYSIDLPFIKHNNYNRYSISTYPVPLNDSGLEVQVNAERDISSHATAGFWFVPRHCRGWRPELCRTGPLYANAYGCVRGLITGQAERWPSTANASHRTG
jgi:hypothetical protein